MSTTMLNTDEFEKPKHYTAGFGIEPLDYIIQNEMDFLEGNIIKYVWRYQYKNGIEDLKKADFYLDRLIEIKDENKG